MINAIVQMSTLRLLEGAAGRREHVARIEAQNTN